MATSATLSEAPSPSSLSRYLHEIRKYPTLDPVHELALARRWTEHQDPAAAERLVTSHLGLIVKIANGFRGYGLPLAELVAEGNVGMMQAIARFDPDRGFRLSTYAMWWIRAAILEYILRSWSMVRVCTTPRHKRLFFKLRKIKTRLQALEDGDLAPETVRTIAAELAVPEGDVVTMNRRLAGPDHSLNAPVSIEGEAEWQDWLIDPSDNQEVLLGERQELDERRGQLHEALVHLSERERHILDARRLRETPLKLDQLAAHYGVSRERIRQIEERAFRKLQAAMGQAPAAVAAKPAKAVPVAEPVAAPLAPPVLVSTSPARDAARAPARPYWQPARPEWRREAALAG